MTSKTIIFYGISNCDTVKLARAWLTARGANYTFHDFKKQGVAKPLLDSWIAAVGWEQLLNRKGTTWRSLDATAQYGVVDAVSAINVMVANRSVIKRPVVQWPGGEITVGFDAEVWRKLTNR